MKLARAQVGIFILVALLQRTPVIKYVLQFEKAINAPIAKLLSAFTLTAAAMGELHAQTGSTQFSIVPASPADAMVGVQFNLAFTITGTPEEVQSWQVTGDIPPGLSVPNLVGDTLNNGTGTITGTPTTAGSYSISIQPWDRLNLSGDTTTARTIVINVAAPPLPDPPAILRNPSSTRVPIGGRAQFFFESIGEVDSIQWLKDDVALTGETSQTLIVQDATESDEGIYTVEVTNAAGTATSSGGTLTIDDEATADLVNLATRGLVGAGDDIMIGGLTVLGGSTKTVLVRGLGPQLTSQGVPGALEDPELKVFQTLFDETPVRSQLLVTNDDWEDGANATELAAALTAQNKPLVAGSKDAALLLTLNQGVYTFQLSGVGDTEGVGLIELFVVAETGP